MWHLSWVSGITRSWSCEGGGQWRDEVIARVTQEEEQPKQTYRSNYWQDVGGYYVYSDVAEMGNDGRWICGDGEAKSWGPRRGDAACRPPCRVRQPDLCCSMKHAFKKQRPDERLMSHSREEVLLIVEVGEAQNQEMEADVPEQTELQVETHGWLGALWEMCLICWNLESMSPPPLCYSQICVYVFFFLSFC